MNDSFEGRLLSTVAAALGVEAHELDMGSSQDTVDAWDSAGIINIVMALESEYGVQFAPEEAPDLLSMAILAEALREKGAA